MTKRKGIILAGGSGTRLYPITIGVSKQLLPIYDKPMIYYPISVLMLAGIREIAIITTPEDQAQFMRTLGDGRQWGLSFTYIVQPSPDGLAQAYLLAKDFLDGAPSAMVLGDNIFFGHGLPEMLAAADKSEAAGTVFGYQVADPERYGVVDFGPGARRARSSRSPRCRRRLRGDRSLFPRRHRAGAGGAGQTLGTRRARDHLASGKLPARWGARRSEDGARLRVAGHRDACEPSGCRQFRADPDRTAGNAERIARGNRLCAGLDYRRSAARAYQFVYQERLWRLPEIPALRRASGHRPPAASGRRRRTGSLFNRLRALFHRYASHHAARACGTGLPRHRMRRTGNVETVRQIGDGLRLSGWTEAAVLHVSWPGGARDVRPDCPRS
jgi:hypothetical protein